MGRRDEEDEVVFRVLEEEEDRGGMMGVRPDPFACFRVPVDMLGGGGEGGGALDLEAIMRETMEARRRRGQGEEESEESDSDSEEEEGGGGME